MAYKDPEFRKAKDRARRQIVVDKIRAHLGGRCVVCGAAGAVEVHHKDPAEKSFNPIQSWTKPWPEISKELEKCELRCFEHHKAVHEARHGTLSRYVNNGCRCHPCVEAHRNYDRAKHQRYRDEKKASGLPL